MILRTTTTPWYLRIGAHTALRCPVCYQVLEIWRCRYCYACGAAVHKRCVRASVPSTLVAHCVDCSEDEL